VLPVNFRPLAWDKTFLLAYFSHHGILDAKITTGRNTVNVTGVIVITAISIENVTRITRGSATAKSTARPSCLVGELHENSRERIC